MNTPISIWKLVINEIRYRKLNFILSVISVFIASSALIGSIVVLRIHDVHTGRILEKKEMELVSRMAKLEDDTRKSMLGLGFNIVILPEKQELSDWYEKGYSEEYMPEDYVDKLAKSGIIIVRHFFPTLQMKTDWPEEKRKIILIGTRGEVPNLVKKTSEPMIDPVPKGFITLGYELHRSLEFKKGDKLSLLGREFVVNECYQERGSQDDISAWIHLEEAQEVFQKPGSINAILALECLCIGDVPLGKLREEITGILPGTRVVEKGGRAIARAETMLNLQKEAKTVIMAEKKKREELRSIRENFASFLIPVILLACGIWIAFLGLMNSRARQEEIGILRAFGVSVEQVLKAFLYKFIIIGVCGGLFGFLGGVFSGMLFGNILEGRFIWFSSGSASFLYLLLLAVAGSGILSIIAGWIPALVAARQDPAVVLHRE